MAITTIQSGIKHHTQDSLTNYALFMGGTNVTHDVLQNTGCLFKFHTHGNQHINASFTCV